MIKSFASGLLFCLITIFVAAPSFAQDSSALDDALSARWNTQEVPAVEGKIQFVTAKNVELALSIGYLPNDDYANIIPIVLDAAYHFNAAWSLGLRGTILAAHTDSTLKSFLDQHQATLDSKLLYEDQLGDLNLIAAYHPLYGKWTAATTSLGTFDWGVFLGLGAVFTDSPNEAHTERERTAHFQGVLGMDAHVFFYDWLALRLEASIRLYRGSEQFMAPCFLGAGVSFFIPTSKEDK